MAGGSASAIDATEEASQPSDCSDGEWSVATGSRRRGRGKAKATAGAAAGGAAPQSSGTRRPVDAPERSSADSNRCSTPPRATHPRSSTASWSARASPPAPRAIIIVGDRCARLATCHTVHYLPREMHSLCVLG